MGLPLSSALHRCRPGGPWQSLLPGLILAHNGPPTARQLRRAAVKYAGEGAVITGAAALEALGSRRQSAPTVHVLVPHARKRLSIRFVVVERTSRMPTAKNVLGVPVAPPEHAAVDAARRMKDLAAVRALVADAVQRLGCRPPDLAMEVSAAQRRGTSLVRTVVAEMLVGVRSAAEADGRAALVRASVREPEWNVALYAEDGEFLGVVDGWYDDVAVALEIDSMEFHFTAADYKRTRRQARLAQAGVLVLPVAPGDIKQDPRSFARLVAATLESAPGRDAPRIVRRPTPAGALLP